MTSRRQLRTSVSAELYEEIEKYAKIIDTTRAQTAEYLMAIGANALDLWAEKQLREEDGSPTSCTDYRSAAVALWGEAGRYAYDSYARMRGAYFPELPEQIPIVIGLTAYGKCLGATMGAWEHGPRISLHPTMAFGCGGRFVDDVLVHECLHAWLRQTGRSPDHDSEDWYAEVRRLSPAVLGRAVDIHRGSDRKSVRVPNPNYEPGVDDRKTVVRKIRMGEEHARVASWPHSCRPAGYDYGEPIPCPTY